MDLSIGFPGNGATPPPQNTCVNGVTFSSSSGRTEVTTYFDSTCQPNFIARDAVRTFTVPAGGATSLTVSTQDTIYLPQPGVAAPTPMILANRTSTQTYSGATFDPYGDGYPSLTGGFAETDTNDTLAYTNGQELEDSWELAVSPAAGATNDFCFQHAGFNATGYNNGVTYGWQGMIGSDGTRVINPSGYPTGAIAWGGTNQGETLQGNINNMAIQTGTQTTACPISTSMFTIANGSLLGGNTVDPQVVIVGGIVEYLSVVNGALASGATVNASSASGAGAPSPEATNYITGTITQNGQQVGNFCESGFGNGDLSVNTQPTAESLVISDWRVLHISATPCPGASAEAATRRSRVR
jgi:hypothetical protein